MHSAELVEAPSFHSAPAMEPLTGEHQCGPYCLRACTLDVRPAFVEALVPEDKEGCSVEGGGLSFVGNMNYMNLLNMGYWNQGGTWNHQRRNGHQEPEQEAAEEPAEEQAEEPGLVMAVAKAEQPESPPHRRRQNRKFTGPQLRELEDLFQETEYPDLLTRYVAGSGGAGSQWVWAHLSVQFSSVKDINIVGQASCRIFYLAKLKLDVEGKPPSTSPTPSSL